MTYDLSKIQHDKEQKRQDILLFVIAATFIVGAITTMFLIDYYAADNQPGQQMPHDAPNQ